MALIPHSYGRTPKATSMSNSSSRGMARSFMVAAIVCMLALITQSNGVAEASFSVGTIPSSLVSLEDHFSKYVSVFGVHIVARSGVPDDKLLHAASVMAQYLDNDMDGEPDDQDVVDTMTGRSAVLACFVDDNDVDDFFDNVDVEDVFPNADALQDLYASEIHTDSMSLVPFTHSAPGHTNPVFDATLEEVLHLITFQGVSPTYPQVFGYEQGSTLSDLIEALNGNCGNGYTSYWTNPSGSGCNGFYAYDDPTCDYECLQVEGLYWALTSILGAQNYSSRCNQIDNEWTLCQPADLAANAPQLHTLLTDYSTHKWLPRVLPDGHYSADISDPPDSSARDGLRAGKSLIWMNVLAMPMLLSSFTLH